jgi:L-malate glycosyltransferase
MHIISGDLWAGAEVQAYTLLKYLKPEVELCVILMNEGELSEKLSALGISPIIIPETKTSSFKIIHAIFKQLRQFKPDVLHTHRQKENIFGSIANLMQVPFNRKLIPSVRTAHGAPEFKPKNKQKIQVWLDRLTGRYLQKKIIAVSDDLAKQLSAIYPIDHITVIHNGVDTETLKKSAQATEWKQNHPDKTHIGIIGRLEPVKRIDIFLETAKILINDHPERSWQFHIIGDGKLKSSLELQAANIGIASQVIFHGHRKDIPACIASLDAIIMCSDHEGTPMTALEALALEKTLIAHNVGGLSEMLKDYPWLLISNHSAAGYAQGLMQFISQPEHRIELPDHYTAQQNMMCTKRLYIESTT